MILQTKSLIFIIVVTSFDAFKIQSVFGSVMDETTRTNKNLARQF